MKQRTTTESKPSDRGDCGEWDAGYGDVNDALRNSGYGRGTRAALLLAAMTFGHAAFTEDATVTSDVGSTSAFIETGRISGPTGGGQ